MNEEGRWITTKSGNRVFIKNNATNEYMNNVIRNKNKKNEFKGHFEEKKDGFEYADGKYKEVKHDAYYQLDNGEKIEFLDKKEYKKMVEDFYDSLTDDEKKALQIWIDDPRWMSGGGVFKYDKDYNKIMDNIFKNKSVELEHDTLLFRRASDDYLDLENGITRKNALSTSAYDNIPKTMPSGIPFGDKELYIIAPKGTKVLPIEKVAVNHPNNNEGDKKIYARQHELVLPKNTSYKMIDDLSEYYYRPAKGNEIYDVPISNQKYVVKLTDNQYTKKDYAKPEYKAHWNNNEYENYIYKHKGQEIEIKETYILDKWERRKKKSRKDAIKYRVSSLAYKNKKEYYDTYDEAIEAIKKYL